MKDSGGERMHYPYGECILSPTDFDVGSKLATQRSINLSCGYNYYIDERNINRGLQVSYPKNPA